LDCTEGFKEAADKFRAESGIEPCSDLSTLDNRIKVREAVLAGNIQAAIALVNDLFPELLDNDRLLCFHLQVDCSCILSVHITMIAWPMNLTLKDDGCVCVINHYVVDTH